MDGRDRELDVFKVRQQLAHGLLIARRVLRGHWLLPAAWVAVWRRETAGPIRGLVVVVSAVAAEAAVRSTVWRAEQAAAVADAGVAWWSEEIGPALTRCNTKASAG